MKRCSTQPSAKTIGPARNAATIGPALGPRNAEHAETGGQIEGGVHAEHQKIALGEIDDAHRAEDDAEPDAHQRIGAADQDAGGQRLQKIDG